MARSRELEEMLDRLAGVARDPGRADAAETLRDALGGASVAAARAAAITGEAGLEALVPDLVQAFGRFMRNPVKRDPGCLAKAAIAEALHQLDVDAGDLFLEGARHVQMEPVFGGRQDTAAALRGASARGLVRMNHADALLVLAELLADHELPARIGAARALAYHGGDAALPVLRLKALEGDREVEVVGECLLAMLRIDAERSTPFVERFLDGPSDVAEAAALALGESRSPVGLVALQSWWRRTTDPGHARCALLAAAMHRSDDAIEWLLDLVRQEPGPVARDAIAAFEVYRSDEALVQRVRDVVRCRDDVELGPHLEATLG